MKIILAALNAKYVHSNLAVYDLQAYAKVQLNQITCRKQPEILIKEYTINHNLDLILQSLYREKAAVVAFSCYIWNIHEILTIARELHKVSPETHIWLGGPEVSYDSEKLLANNPFVEGIIRGEGEVTFYELVKIWMQKDDWKYGIDAEDVYEGVLGITYRDSEARICNNHGRPPMSMDEIPFIYEDLAGFENKILYYETSRGCPFSCSYCLSSIDKRVHFRSLTLVKNELQFFLDHNVPQVKFIDRTFNCNQEHALTIWKYLTEHDNGITNFHFEIAADLLGEEELALFRRMRPGLIQLEIGLQSTNPDTVKEIHRTMNIEKLKMNMLAVQDMHNIHQHLDLIAGLPYEDFVTFQKSFNEAYEMKPDQLQLGFLKVLKGSYMEEQVENYGLQYQDYQPYEVLQTKWLSYDEVLALKKVEEMVEVYYNSDQFNHTIPYLMNFFETPFAFYEAIGDYYEENGLFGIGFKREARYEALRKFMLQCMEKCDMTCFSHTVLDNLLTYDYYLRENAKSRPSWCLGEAVDKAEYHNFFKNGGNDEIDLTHTGYDSKVAARMMHIEPVSLPAMKWIRDASNNPVGNEVPESAATSAICYCLFDYDHRNPLSKDAKVFVLTHL